MVLERFHTPMILHVQYLKPNLSHVTSPYFTQLTREALQVGLTRRRDYARALSRAYPRILLLNGLQRSFIYHAAYIE